MKQIRRIKNTIRKILSYIIPKQKGLFVFIPCHNPKQFSGNIKGLINNIEKEKIDLNYYLLAYRDSYLSEARVVSSQTISHKTKALWYTLRAEHVVIDASVPELKGRFSFIQLWHGTGFKNIGLLNNSLPPKTHKLLRRHYKKYQFVVSSSANDVKKQNESFGTNKTIITGLPRNDVFFNMYKKELILERFDIQENQTIYTYVPTFRDFETMPPFSEEFWEKLNTLLVEKNALFLIKKHPWDEQLIVPSQYSNILDYSQRVSDVQELLLITDVLISDYSSILTDFVITQRPVIVYAYDIDSYIEKCRSIYYELDEILPKPFATNEHELMEKITDDAWTKDEAYLKSYQTFSKNFQYYFDSKSSERVLNEMLKLAKK